MARREVDVAAVEAGLGGRYDATSVVDSRVTVLTNVGLEHTRWSGPTVTDIAEEKLAVVRPRTALVLGEDLAAPALAVAQRVARERGARIVRARAAPAATELLARGAFQRRNFTLARAAAEAYLQASGIPLREQAVAQAAASTEVPGRLQLVDGDPPTVLDGAHNPDAVAALVQALPEVLPGTALALVLGVLEDKDAAGMLAALLPVCERAWFTVPPSSRALSPAALQSHARQLGFDATACEPKPSRASSRRGAGLRSEGAPCWRPDLSTWSGICSPSWAAPITCRWGGQVPGALPDERRRSIRADNDRRRRADRRAGHPRVLRGGLRFRPLVSLNSAGRCHPSHISESKAAAWIWPSIC